MRPARRWRFAVTGQHEPGALQRRAGGLAGRRADLHVGAERVRHRQHHARAAGQRRHRQRRRQHVGAGHLHDHDHAGQRPAGADRAAHHLRDRRQHAAARRRRDASGLASIADAVSILTKSVPTDSDGPAAPAVVAFTGATTSGTATLNADGSFTYVPNAGFTGTDSFSFQVTDGATPVTGTIQVTVGPRVWYVSNQIGAEQRRRRRRPIDRRVRHPHRGGNGIGRERHHLRVQRRQPDDAARRHHAQERPEAVRRGRRSDHRALRHHRPGRHGAAADERRQHHRRAGEHGQRRPHRRRDPRPHPGEHGRQRHRRDVGRRRDPRRPDQREHDHRRDARKASTSIRARAGRPRSPCTTTRSPPRARASTSRARPAPSHHRIRRQRRVRRHGRLGHHRQRPVRHLRRDAGRLVRRRRPAARRRSASPATV